MVGALENLTNPALLFFILGILAVNFKSDLKIPDNSSKFIAIYLLLSIGFKGGNELAHSHISSEIFGCMLLGFLLSSLVPLNAFFILKNKVGIKNAGAFGVLFKLALIMKLESTG